MRAIQRVGKRGVTLMELMFAIAIGGVACTLGIYGVRLYLVRSKTAEAKSMVNVITRAAVAAYERETSLSCLLDDEACESIHHIRCGSDSGWVPGTPPAATTYQPSMVEGSDFNTGDPFNGWKCLRFILIEPTYYSLHYVAGVGSGRSGATANGFEAAAQGGLDGNGKLSFFARGADVRNGSVVVSTELFIQNEYE